MTPQPTDTSNLSKQLEQIVEGVQQTRLMQLTEWAELQEAKELALHVEQARLSAKYGPDSPQVKEIQIRLEPETVLRKQIGSEMDRLKAKFPEPEKQEAIISGRVLDMNETGMVGVFVVAMLDQGKEVARTISEQDGYYTLRLKTEQPLKIVLEVYNRPKNILLGRDAEILSVTGLKKIYRTLTIAENK